MTDHFINIEELWAGFENNALPPTAPRRQRTEMRKAFITGYWSALEMVRCIPEGADEDDAADALEAHWRDVKSKFNALDGSQ